MGAIDAKYDVAISSTCGSLDNIVVDTVETAQLAIEFLKRERLEVCSFLALEKMRPVRPRMDIPAGSQRLFDLIRVEDERVLPAFYFATVGDMLVVDSDDIAHRINAEYGRRWRIVDLAGNLFDPSGSMTGGGRPIR